MAMKFGMMGIAVSACLASASVVSVSESSATLARPGEQSPQGTDDVRIAPGLGNAGGFVLAGGPFTDHAFPSVGENIGAGLNSDILLSSSMVDNGGGNFDIRIFMESIDGSDMFPSGFASGGVPLTRAGFFMGANAGGPVLSFEDVALTNSATIEIFDSAGSAGGPFDISGFGVFSALGGGWSGSLGVNFGDDTAGLGINAVELLVNVTVVPAPGAVALLAMGGLVTTRRRR